MGIIPTQRTNAIEGSEGDGKAVAPETVLSSARVAEAHARYDAGLRRFFAARGASSSTDELAQQTWALVWQSVRAGRYDPARASLGTFVYAVATNVWHRFRTKAAGSRESDVAEIDRLAEREMASASDPASTAGFAELIEAVTRCVAGEHPDLTPEDRAVLLALARGASDRDLATQLGVAPSTAHARKTSALGKLRRALGAMGYRSGADLRERPGGGGE